MKQKEVLRRTMAGVLSAAMIMTNLSSGSMMAFAEEPADIIVDEDADADYADPDMDVGQDTEASVMIENLEEMTIEEQASNEEAQTCNHTNVQVDPALDATCTVDGHTEGRYCLDCGTTLLEMQTIKAEGHVVVKDEAVEATCTSTGLTEGSHCSACGEVLTAQVVIPALGHDVVKDEAIAPTSTESGLTEGAHCSVCGEVFAAQELIPATGLTYNYDVLYEEALDYLPIKEGEALTFTNFATANPGVELSYQWYYEGYYDMDYNPHMMWVDEDKSIEEMLEKMEGETGRSLTIKFDTIDWIKRFYVCVITDEYGNSITQDFAAYAVTGLTYNQDAQHSYTVACGESCTLNSSAVNDTNTELSYQWYTADGLGQYDEWINSQAIEGATESSYTFTADHTQIYYCEVTDKYGNPVEESFQVCVNSGLAYNEEVTHSYAVAPNENWIQLSSTATVTDGSALSYQWYACGYYDADNNWVEEAAIEGENDYTINVYVDRARSYYCRATDSYGNYVDEYYTVSIENHLTCDESAPHEYEKYCGESITLTSTADADDLTDVSYQWYEEGCDENGDSTIEAIENASGKTCEVTVGDEDENYLCEIKDKYGNSVTETFHVNVLERIDTGLDCETTENTVFLYPGQESVTLSSTASANEGIELSYQWYIAGYYNDDDQWIEDKAIKGATGISCTVSADNQEYYCCAEDHYGNSIQEYFTLNSSVSANGTINVSESGKYEKGYFKLNVPKTGAYILQSSGDADTIAYIYEYSNNTCKLLDMDDDSGSNFNFKITCNLNTANIYYVYLDYFDEEEVGSARILFDPVSYCDIWGHTEKTVAGKEATCEESGYTESIICSKCGEILTEAKAIPALGHKLVPSWSLDEEYVAILTVACERCDYSKTYDPADNYVEQVTTDATCINPGKTVTTVISHGYKASFTETTPATGVHQYYDVDETAMICPGCGSTKPDETSVSLGDTTANVRITDLISIDNTVNINAKAADYATMAKVADNITVDSDQVLASSEDKLTAAEILQKVINDNTDDNTNVSQILQKASSIDMTQTMSMQVDVLGYDKTEDNKTIKLDITPIVTTTVVANNSDSSRNTYTVTEEIHELQDNKAITVTIPLPTGFAGVGETIKIVLAHDGKDYSFFASVKMDSSNKLYAEFDNNIGFSDVSLYAFADWDYDWAEDGSSCTLYAVFSDGNKVKVDPADLEDEDITVYEISSLSCTTAGETKYTYTASYTGTEYPTNVLIFGEKSIRVAPAHTIVTDAKVAATCTRDGLTEGSHCSVCDSDDVRVAQEVIPATGHTVVKDAAKAATCTSTGLTEGSHCSVCGTVITKQNVVAATGHKAGEWTTTKAATNLEAGEEVQKCMVCGAVLNTRAIPRISSVTLYKGVNKSYTLTAGKWKLKKTKAAKLKGNKLTIKKTGTIKVTEQKTKQTVTIKVKKPTLSLNKKKVTLKVGATFQINASATPAANISYKSAKSRIAKVSSTGLITAVKKGKTTITVKANGVKKKITVVVKKK